MKADGCSSGPTSSIEPCADCLEQYTQALTVGSVEVSRVRRCLVELGLLHPMPGGRAVVVPVSPEDALETLVRPLDRLIEENRRESSRLRRRISMFRSAYEGAGRPEGSLVRVLRGKELIRARLDRALHECQAELLTVQPGGFRDPQDLQEALRRDLPALRRGVSQRTLYQHAIRSHQPTRAYIDAVVAAGAKVRTASEVIERLIVCDSRVAFIPADADRTVEALEIHHPALIRFLVGSFNQAWEHGLDIRRDDVALARSAEAVDDLQGQIARLVIEGHTDESVGRRLGMNRRTVAKYVGKLSERFGSSSRAQLGYLIAQSGFLEGRRSASPVPDEKSVARRSMA